MKKISQLLLLVFLCIGQLSAQVNVTLLHQFHRGDVRYSGSWIYNAPDGTEYALLGARTGLAAYDMGAIDIEELGFIPGPESNWREVTVVGDHAYVVTEGTGPGEGMQVVDLTYLPDSLHLVTTFTDAFYKGHIIQRDIYSEDPYVYVNGYDGNGGISILDISNPATPIEIGNYDPEYYIHDCMIKGDRIYASAFFESQIDVLDISDKTNPTLITTIEDPGTNTHSTWITEDDRYLVVCDELDTYPMRILKIEDLNNPTEVATYTASEPSLVHNPYIRGDFLFVSHNALGLRVLDIADPELPVEVGYYDTYTTGGDSGSHGLWSASPFSNSGKIIGGNREDGLYVWEFNNTKAGRFYGTVKDSITGEILYNANVLLDPLDTLLEIGLVSDIFKYGDFATNDLSLTASLTGYNSKTVSFDLLTEDSLWLEIKLVPEGWVGIPRIEKDLPFLSVYPNPANDFISVDLSTMKEVDQLVCVNVLGMEVLNLKTNNHIKVDIPLNGISEGLYFLKGLDENGKLIGVGTFVKE